MKRIILLLVCISLVLTFFGVVHAKEEWDNYDIIVELARSYDRKGGKILYDQKNARRNIYSSPEEATSQRTMFLDCSSYVNACYREGFGVNVMPMEIGATGTSPNTSNMVAYARDNQSAADVVGYWEPAEYTEEKKTQTVEYIYSHLQIGDVVVYLHGKSKESTSGHCYIYIGDNTYMHCAGSGSYYINSKNPALSHDDSEIEKDWGGTIRYIDNHEIFEDAASGRYMFKRTASNTVWSFCILRPMARGITPTQEAFARMKIAGMCMEKISSVYENTAVDKGDTITYTITMENTNEYNVKNLKITDTLPLGTKFAYGDKNVKSKDGNITWQGKVPAKETVSVSYTVEVTEDTPGFVIKSDATYVSGVKLGSIEHSVSGITQTQRALLGDAFIKEAQAHSSFGNGVELAKSVYKTTLGIDIFKHSSTTEVLDDVIGDNNRTHRTDTDVSKMIAPNLYGGQNTKYGWLYLPEEENRTRMPFIEHLSVGDIILGDKEEQNIAYVYAGNNNLVTVEDGVCKKVVIDEDIYSPQRNVLISLLAYNRYAILRPSMVNTSPDLDVVSIAVTKSPNKTAYKSMEFFNPDGMVVTAELNDGTKREVYGYTFGKVPLNSKDKSATVYFGDASVDVSIKVSSTVGAISVSQALLMEDATPATVEGIVFGVTQDGRRGKQELYLKDTQNDNIIALRGIPYGEYPCYGYKSGDKIRVIATVKNGTPVNMTYTSKMYLEFSPFNGDIKSTIISRGNDISKLPQNVVTLNTWEDMQKYFEVGKTPVYSYVKIPAGTYLCAVPQEEGEVYNITYLVHKNPSAASLADAYAGSKAHIGIRLESLKANLGENWSELLFDTSKDALPGVFVTKDITALYTGGEKNIYQLVIPHEKWINSVDSVEIKAEDTEKCKVVFADYADGTLKDIYSGSWTYGDNGAISAKIPKEMDLTGDDRIIIWNTKNNKTISGEVFGVKSEE